MMKGDNNMRTKMFEYRRGFGSIKNQLEIPLNEFLKILDKEDNYYKIKYIPTNKGIIAVVEYGS